MVGTYISPAEYCWSSNPDFSDISTIRRQLIPVFIHNLDINQSERAAGGANVVDLILD